MHTVRMSVLSICFLTWLVSPLIAEAATLTVQVYRTGSWSAGQGDWIKGARVGIQETRKGRSYTKTSNATGKAIFHGIDPGPVTLMIKKAGCDEIRKTFQMVRSNVTKNIALSCKSSGRPHKLTITAIDGSAKSCGINRVLRGKTINLYSANNLLIKTGKTNQRGVVTFSVPPGEYKSKAWNDGEGGCTMRNRVETKDIRMPARAHGVTQPVSCAPSDRYTLEARLAVTGTVPRAGGNLALSIVAENLGPGQPSYPVTVSVARRLKSGPPNVWGSVGGFTSRFPIDSLCAGETGVASIVDRNVEPGVWIYRAAFQEERRYRDVAYRYREIEVNIRPATPKFRRMP